MQGNLAITASTMLAWPLVALIAFRFLGRRNGVLFTVVGGYLFLPPVTFAIPRQHGLGPFLFEKQAVISLSLIAAILVWDARAFFRFRPKPLDAPMFVFVGFMGLIAVAGQYVPWEVATGIAWVRFWWIVPYLAARLYFGDTEGARRIGVAVVLGGLAYVPVVAFETLLGPSWYLRSLVYGLPVNEAMSQRLGGWRPEGFLNHGIELSCWMALAAVFATWLWLARAWRPRWGPSLVLILATLATRGVYGYINLAVGVLAVVLTVSFRTRFIIAALALLAPLYCGLRTSGVWDGKTLVNLARSAGRASTVQVRIDCEDRMIAGVLDRNPAFGFGRPLGLVWNSKAVAPEPGADGGWLVYLWVGGILGLSLQLAAMLGFPVGLALIRTTSHTEPDEIGSPVWGLALFTTLAALDGLHNNASFMPTALAAGAFVSLTLGGESARTWTGSDTRERPWRQRPASGRTRGASRESGYSMSDPAARFGRPALIAVLVLGLLILPEIMARMTGSGTSPSPNAPDPQPVGRVPREINPGTKE